MRKRLHFLWLLLTAPFRLAFRLGRLLVLGVRRVIRETYWLFTAEVENAPLWEAFDKAIENPAALLIHLEALRKHLLRSLIALSLTTALSFTFFNQILAFLARPLPGGLQALVAIEVIEPLATAMRVVLLSGFALALPYIIFELWLFFAPALTLRSRWMGFLLIPLATLLFVGGMAFAYYFMLPAALPFLMNFMGFTTVPRPSSYIKFATGLMFWIGVAFEFPLIILIFAKLGWVKAKTLLQQWRLAVVIISVIAAFITPTIDPINMSLVMFPMIALYFFSALLAWIAQRGAPAEAPESSSQPPTQGS